MPGVSDDQTPGLHLATLEIELVCGVGDFATFLGEKVVSVQGDVKPATPNTVLSS